MQSLPSPIELEVGRIRLLSRSGQYGEALAAAEALAVAASENRDALYLVATNQRCLNRVSEALMTLAQLEEQDAGFSLLYQERGHCYTTLQDAPRAIGAFVRAVEINPALKTSWSMLERLYRITGDVGNAAAATERVLTLNHLAPEVVRAASLLPDGAESAAEGILRDYLRECGEDVAALRLLARIKQQHEALDEAESLLEAALKLEPNHLAARLDYVGVLIDRQKYLRAREEIERLLRLDASNRDYLLLHAGACAGLGEHEPAIAVYRQLLADLPRSAELYVSLGHTLQMAGRRKEATEAYRMAATVRPGFGDAWWSLANLKNYRFSEKEIAHMRAGEAVPDADPTDRYQLCFALGAAFEERKQYAESWLYYERGNALKCGESRYHPAISESNTRRQMEVCTAQFFAARMGVGAPDPDAIFIVGLPRSGSTLIEQILASHSQVDGTQELAEIQRIVNDLSYPEALTELPPEDFRSLGERYLADTRAYRRNKPFFVDKMPNNFRHIGLIHLLLPNAKIIDVRREPMACSFSNLKQLFANGQEFTYSIAGIASYYRSYLELMRHWDSVLPGRILRVCYEDVVEDLDGNVRRMLEFCGLPFEPACIDFYKTDRSVCTASSEQVRQPISRDGLLQWRNYEQWLGPLKDGLQDAVERYRE